MSDLKHSLHMLSQKNLPTLLSGHASDIQTLWTDVIEPTLPDKDRVIAMFNVLAQYVEDDDAVFVIRNGSTRVNNDPKTLRRGFLTTLTGDQRKYVYADNDFATIMCKLVYDTDWDINYPEFKAAMLNYAFPIHFNSSCKEERDKAVFPLTTTAPYVGKKGYKVSHVFGAGTEYAFDDGSILNIAAICEKYFPLNDYDDWIETSPGFYSREMPGPLNNDAIAFLKAHFLRFACPLNYILTPKKTCQTANRKINKNDIGEHPRLLEFAKEQLRRYYGSTIFDTYTAMLMIPDDDYIGLDYGLPTAATTPAATIPAPTTTTAPATVSTVSATTPRTTKSKTKSGTVGYRAQHYTYDQQLEVAAYYFKNTVGLIPVEENCLKLYNADGWVSRDILQTLGIDTNGAYKGLLRRITIDDAITKYHGKLKTTLEEIKARGLHL